MNSESDFFDWLASTDYGENLEPLQIEFIEKVYRGSHSHVHVHTGRKHSAFLSRMVTEFWLDQALWSQFEGEDIHGELPDGSRFMVIGGAKPLVRQMLAEAERVKR